MILSGLVDGEEDVAKAVRYPAMSGIVTRD
jgi:hypothetical protein